MRVGALTVDRCTTGRRPGRPGYPPRPRPAGPWEKFGHYVDDAGNIQLICGGYLLRSGERVVLIDAGLGEYEDEQWHGGQFLDSLRGLGVTPAEVTDVVFTHLTGITSAGRPARARSSSATPRPRTPGGLGALRGAPDADPEDTGRFPRLPGGWRPLTRSDTAARSRRTPRPRPHARVDNLRGVERQRGLLLIGDVLHTPAG